MIDAVYFLAQGQAFYGHEELRYSLRSLEQHAAGVAQVYIIGADCQWTTKELRQIPETDPFEHNHDANIIRKMHRACQLEEISDPFLFVNDDHYFSQGCLAEAFLYYHKGEIKAFRPVREYDLRLANTRRLLEEQGRSTLNFDLHAPILIWKEKFIEALAGWEWADETGPGVVMKSVYGNCVPEIAAAGVYLPDCKLTVRTRGTAAGWIEQLKERPCWSSGNHVPRLVWEILREMYPEPSQFE